MEDGDFPKLLCKGTLKDSSSDSSALERSPPIGGSAWERRPALVTLL